MKRGVANFLRARLGLVARQLGQHRRARRRLMTTGEWRRLMPWEYNGYTERNLARVARLIGERLEEEGRVG